MPLDTTALFLLSALEQLDRFDRHFDESVPVLASAVRRA
jgi:hypothetical protein